jgi:predicted O-methyltransferase YrrM
MSSLYWLILLGLSGVALFAMLAMIWRRVDGILRELKQTHAVVDRIAVHHLPEVTKQVQYIALLEHELALDRPLPPTRGFAASPDFLHGVASAVLEARPEICVEFGSGVSTLVTARCLQKNGKGKLFSFDHDKAWAQTTRDMLKHYGLADYAQVIDAPIEPITTAGRDTRWYRTSDIPESGIDFFVIDGPPMSTGPAARLPALHVLAPRLSPGAVGFLDDASRASEQAALADWKQAFPEIAQSWCYFEKGGVRFDRK